MPSKNIAVSKRIDRYRGYAQAVFDVYEYNEHGEWLLLSRAIGPSLIKEFFNIEVTR